MLYSQEISANEPISCLPEKSPAEIAIDHYQWTHWLARHSYLPTIFAFLMVILPFNGYARMNSQDASNSDIDGKGAQFPSFTSTGLQQLSATQPIAQPFDVTVNGSKSGTWVLLEYLGELYAPLDAFAQWRLQPSPMRPPLRFRRLDYYSLGAIPGYTSKVDFSNQSVDLNFAPNAFSVTRQGATSLKRVLAAPATPSIFINYEISHQRTESPHTPIQNNTGLLGEIAFSSSLGFFNSSFIGQLGGSSKDSGNQSRPLRLETTYTHDFQDNNSSLHLGDTATRMGMLGDSVYYGGFRLGTDFTLTPGFIAQPLPITKGVSSAPSTVELYVNDIFRQTTHVPSGPFTIENIPPISGAGEVRMVVRDIFGRESVITRSFFSSNRLLAPDLIDWSLEGGRIRHDIGSSTSYYGEPFTRGLLRYGLSENLTVEGVTEIAGKQRNLQMGISSPIGAWLGGSALTISQKPQAGSGLNWLASLEQTGMHHGISLQAIGASARYRSLASEHPPSRRQFSANLTYATGELGSFGIGLASIRTFIDEQINTLSASYSFRVGSRGTLSIFASRSTGTSLEGTALGMTLMIPLNKGPSITTSAKQRGREIDIYTSTAENPTNNTPFGWRTLIGHQQGGELEEAGLSYRGTHFQLMADASHDSSGMSAQRLSAVGGLVFAGGDIFALREFNESLALVEVPGYANVGVGLGNTSDRKTNANGIALVPNLLPYQENSIILNAQDLPISAELDSIEHIAVPGRRSVIRVRFPVRGGQGALIRILLEDGTAPPVGSVVGIPNDSRDFFVARRGEVFVTGLQPTNKLVLKHTGGQCELIVDVPPASLHRILRLGPLECKEVAK